ncbi:MULTISPECIES: hypothetical protein [Halostella]|uniref:hypothetical protein n=1 Tax=Halostella TaxID=1843185 RepID=UPI00108020A8|nr:MULTISPECIES: hypothetical protein [Halostella]
MGSDGLIELDEECWTALAKYNLLLSTLFAALLLVTRTVAPEQTVLIVQNGVLALLFGGVQTYCWISR